MFSDFHFELKTFLNYTGWLNLAVFIMKIFLATIGFELKNSKTTKQHTKSRYPVYFPSLCGFVKHVTLFFV